MVKKFPTCRKFSWKSIKIEQNFLYFWENGKKNSALCARGEISKPTLDTWKSIQFFFVYTHKSCGRGIVPIWPNYPMIVAYLKIYSSLKKHATMVIWGYHLFWVAISYLIGGIIRNLSAYCGMIKTHRHCCWDTLFHTLQKQPFSIVQQFFECDFWKITLTSKSDQYLGPEITWDLENS